MIRCLCKSGFVVKPGAEWPTTCPLCGGRSEVSVGTLCTLIEENETTMTKLLRPKKRMIAKVAFRIFGKLAKLVEEHAHG